MVQLTKDADFTFGSVSLFEVIKQCDCSNTDGSMRLSLRLHNLSRVDMKVRFFSPSR